jgi:outer membrane lipopolysaccharide assembly protein LptE/RlpB
MPRPRLLLLAGLALALGGCGYRLGARPLVGGVRALSVPAVRGEGIDLDAEAELARALRRAVARGPSTRLVPAGAADARLAVRLISADAGLAPLSDGAARASDYELRVRVSATLIRGVEEVIWRSGPVEGRAPYFSVPDAAEALDGARRRALARACEAAAEQLLGALAAAPQAPVAVGVASSTVATPAPPLGLEPDVGDVAPTAGE